MVSPKDCLWGEDFFQTYMKHAKRMSYNNDILHMSGAVSLVGQALRDVYLRIDQQHTGCRVHPFIIQSSGTGKNSAFGMLGTVARAADMPFDEEGTASTAGIMGTVKRNGDTIKGDLAGSGFVAWKEAQTLLKSAEQTHSSDILEVMNMAMDPAGKVEKSLSGGKLEYSSNTSVFCTTYDPEPNGQLELVRQGFLPRTLFFYRTMGRDFYSEINEMRDEKVPRPGENNEPYRWEMEEDIEMLANTLKYIEDTVWDFGKILRQGESHYAVADEHIEYFEGVEEGVSINPSPMITDVMESYPYKVRQQAQPFETRMMNKVYRLSAIFAAADYDEENDNYVSRIIRERHVRMAKKIAKQSFECVMDFIHDYSAVGGNNTLKDVERSVQTIARNNGGHATVREIMGETYRTKREVKEALASLEEMRKVESVDNPVTALDSDDKVKPVQG